MKIYKIHCGYCIEPWSEIYRKASHRDPIYVTLLRHLIRFLLTCHQFLKYSMIFPLQWLVRTAKYPLLIMHGVLHASVKFRNGNTWSLYVQIGQVIMHGRRGQTPCNVSGGRSTWCFAKSLPFVWQTFVGFISPHQFSWFDNSRWIWKPVVYSGAISYPFRHGADVEAKVWFLSRPRRCYVSATADSVHATNPNPLKLCFSVEVWDNILTNTLVPSWVIIALWLICHPYTDTCHQFVAYCASNSNCRLWRNLRTSEHISRLECIIWSNIFFTHFQCYSLLNADTILYSSKMFHFCPRSYGIIAVCSTLHHTVCVSNIVKQV